jgi:hypothetical protein
MQVFTGRPEAGGSSGATSIITLTEWGALAGQSLQRLGVILESDNTTSKMALTVGDKLGILEVDDLGGCTQSGSGKPGSTLTLAGTLAQLNSALTNLSYTAGSVTGQDTVSIEFDDRADGLLASGSLNVSVIGLPLNPTLPVITPPPGTQTAVARPNFSYVDTTTGTSGTSNGTGYTGPVSYIKQQYIWSGSNSVAIAADTSNVFMHGGPGDDALTAISGSNVLDGGSGSNFLVGAPGTDGGFDTFFDDGRGAQVTWDTLVHFHHGDAATIFGFKGGLSTMQWADNEGATGYKGATLHSELGGTGTGINATITFAGLSLSDAQAKLTISTGNIDGNAYLYLKYS